MRPIEHLQSMVAQTRREFTKKYCLHPKAPAGCGTVISSAHSVQRAMLHRFIATKGHVVQIKLTAHVDPVGLLAAPEEVGINKATAFFGFCNKHDTELFFPLESSAFNFEPEKIALLGYRAVCRELYGKDAEIAAADANWRYASLIPDTAAFHEKQEVHRITQMARINAQANLKSAKNSYAEMLSDGSALRFYAVAFAGLPVYLCSVAFLPEWDFDGGRIQDLSFITEYHPICFSAWAAGDRTAAIFCWHKSADRVCVPFVNSLRRIAKDNLSNRVLSMAFDVSENVVFRRDWWDSITEGDRQRIVRRSMSGVGHFGREATCLADDGLRALPLPIESEHVGY
jgi:hypothetical protein